MAKKSTKKNPDKSEVKGNAPLIDNAIDGIVTIKKESNGEVETFEVNKEVLLLTSKINQDNFHRAIEFTGTIERQAKTYRSEYYNVGAVLKEAKEACNKNTRLYGQWVQYYFGSTFDKYTLSKIVYMFENQTEIEAWANAYKPNLHSPGAITRLFKAYKRKGEDKGEETVGAESKGNTKDKGVAGVYEDTRKAVNACIKALKADTMPPRMVRDVYALADNLTEALSDWFDSHDFTADSLQEKFEEEDKQADVRKVVNG